MDAALKAIAEPRRRAILRLVATSELAAGEIAEHFDISRPAISQHLSVLKDADLITERRDGVKRFYRARPESLQEIRDFIDEFWNEALAQLKHLAELEERKKRKRNGRRH